ncbi:MAG: MFS transporter [Gammaproteobacteria bacterium]|nr:MAG: MFS transporter [Gammaproteobacteria bacterium]RLA60069.1 MAG: MFS transporter [Gammaproteobacteria bacterium]
MAGEVFFPPARIWWTAVLGCICITPLLLSPVITGVLVDYGGMSNTEAGLTAGFSAIGSVVIALICSLFMHHLPLRKLAFVGITLAVVTNIASAFCYEQLSLFYALRAINALGGGACYAAVMSSYAREKNSERCYGSFMTLQFGLGAVGLYLLPTFAPGMNAEQLYLLIAFIYLLAIPLIRYLPLKAALAEGVSIRASEWRLLLTLPALAGLGALCFFEVSNTANAAYLERIAVLAEIPDDDIGVALGLYSLIGVPGAFAIFWLGARFGHAKPIIAGILVGAIALFALFQVSTFMGYLTAICTISLTWAFTLPYLQSVLADQDPGGAVVAAGGIASGAGGGIGPASAAMLVTTNDYTGVLIVGLTGYLIALVFVLLAAGRTPVTAQPG